MALRVSLNDIHRNFNITTMKTTTYRGWKIEPDTEPWVLKYYGKNAVRLYFSDEPDENTRWAASIQEAKDSIDDIIIRMLEVELGNEAKKIEALTDHLKLARQCIEACRNEFNYQLSKALVPSTHAVATGYLTLCERALSHLPVFDPAPDAAAANEVIRASYEAMKAYLSIINPSEKEI